MTRSPETFRGIQGVDVSSAFSLFNPENAFRLVDGVNDGQKREKWIKIEVYPTTDRHGLLSLLCRGAAKFRLHLPIAGDVTADKIKNWQSKYPNTQVSSVHLPFSYDLSEAFRRPLVETTLREKAYHLAWLFELGPTTNMKGVDLARRLNKETDQEVAITMHPNIASGFTKAGTLNDLKSIGRIYVENEHDYRVSPSLVEDRGLISNPSLIAGFVKEHNLDGFVLGVDHLVERNISPNTALGDKTVVEQIRAIHLSGASNKSHDAITAGDPILTEFLGKVSETDFVFPVRAVLDYSPFVMAKMSMQEQSDLIKSTIKWVMNTQR